jgi:CHAT domain-containing protein
MSAARDDFELLIGSNPSAPFQYWGQVLNSLGGQTQTCPLSFRFLPTNNNSELEILKLKIENAVLKGGEANLRGPISPSESILIQFGKQAFQSIFVDTGPIRDAYVGSKAALGATSENNRMKIRLRLEPPELAGLPWEYLYDESDPIKYLSLKHSLVRSFEQQQRTRPVRINGPLRILGMIANPSSHEWPAVDEAMERRRIESAIDKLQKEGRIAFEWLGSGTSHSLLTRLLEEEWHVFHFVGHGGTDDPSQPPNNADEQSDESGFIVFVDEKGAAVKKYASELATDLGSAARSLKLAVLNCCDSAKTTNREKFGSPAAALVKSGLSAVVAMQYPITDSAAINMADGFYRALTNGRSIEEAVTVARIFMKNKSKIEWGIPVLYMNPIEGDLFEFDDFEPKVDRDASRKAPDAAKEDNEGRVATSPFEDISHKLREFNRLIHNDNNTTQELELLSKLGRDLIQFKKGDS